MNAYNLHLLRRVCRCLHDGRAGSRHPCYGLGVHAAGAWCGECFWTGMNGMGAGSGLGCRRASGTERTAGYSLSGTTSTGGGSGGGGGRSRGQERAEVCLMDWAVEESVGTKGGDTVTPGRIHRHLSPHRDRNAAGELCCFRSALFRGSQLPALGGLHHKTKALA